ncbi:hypothetical protein PHSY_002747 [Pseudozyma hubeiensis SY62]|uniref:Uncharacterized protein n=1 Tax=Pseudozyma hubeiensis (strain SY62) TaxID=1305764 RepID=R9P1X0_PSEHS|nr:hypothetical protein PHSY_002747 [Pseudozyma hubeiensis SY62]GAC95172.1 hypothetical protein PHSY_002747 [Pseudozyma hubeiensis SY62]
MHCCATAQHSSKEPSTRSSVITAKTPVCLLSRKFFRHLAVTRRSRAEFRGNSPREEEQQNGVVETLSLLIFASSVAACRSPRPAMSLRQLRHEQHDGFGESENGDHPLRHRRVPPSGGMIFHATVTPPLVSLLRIKYRNDGYAV